MEQACFSKHTHTHTRTHKYLATTNNALQHKQFNALNKKRRTKIEFMSVIISFKKILCINAYMRYLT